MQCKLLLCLTHSHMGLTALLHLQEQGELQAAVEQSCVALGLQPVASFVRKCLQLQETFGVRFGVMLIGPAGAQMGLLSAACHC